MQFLDQPSMPCLPFIPNFMKKFILGIQTS